MSRPEHLAPPEIFYNETEAEKYTRSTRIQNIQVELAERCLELLNLPPSSIDPSRPSPSMLLDIGCGSGLSGEVIESEGHFWCGVDISGHMLEIALEREVQGDLFLQDIGQGFGYRPGSFDGAISVSVIQWLCNSDKTENSVPQRLSRFFGTLYASLSRGSRAVFQFYPESNNQVELIMSNALKSGFSGGLVVDYPNSSKKKKFYLVLLAGQSNQSSSEKGFELPAALGVDGNDDMEESGQTVQYEGRRQKIEKRHQMRRNGQNIKDREWIMKKKDLYRRRGKEVPNDSKYSGRKRKPKF